MLSTTWCIIIIIGLTEIVTHQNHSQPNACVNFLYFKHWPKSPPLWTYSLYFYPQHICLPTHDTLGQQAALQPADSLGRPIPFTDDQSFPRFPTETQALVTSYQFVVCGNITRWQTLIRPLIFEYTVSFQVWRPRSTPDSTSTSIVYDLIGRNTMSFPGTLPTSDHQPVILTVEPSEYISVLPGDIVGFYVLRGEVSDEIILAILGGNVGPTSLLKLL